MNYVQQVVDAIKAGPKVAWILVCASGAVLACDHFKPEWFDGLPSWALPTFRVVFIFFAVVALYPLVLFVADFIKTKTQAAYRRLVAPTRQSRMRRALLQLTPDEIHVVSTALARSDRDVSLKPHARVTLTLVDKGVLISEPLLVVCGDGTRYFQIESDVWRLLLTMPEFQLPDPEGLIRAQIQGASPRRLLQLLPQGHPVIGEALSKS
ncbi:hypothetical protein [uncultured Salipiger sp.]|uniref:hypothetical protein n=1 Tax=uncultured Salipiger sp. TaxID=499810 RepID=UPI0025960BF0|nr:hypothetical protein [uncultured Salipiger sp.]